MGRGLVFHSGSRCECSDSELRLAPETPLLWVEGSRSVSEARATGTPLLQKQ